MSESPSIKKGKNKITSTKPSRKKHNDKVNELDKKSLNTRKKMEHSKEEHDFYEDSFSMTYSEEENKDPKKKCQIS